MKTYDSINLHLSASCRTSAQISLRPLRLIFPTTKCSKLSLSLRTLALGHSIATFPPSWSPQLAHLLEASLHPLQAQHIIQVHPSGSVGYPIPQSMELLGSDHILTALVRPLEHNTLNKFHLQDRKPIGPWFGHTHDLICHITPELRTCIHINQIGILQRLLWSCILGVCFCGQMIKMKCMLEGVGITKWFYVWWLGM